MDEETNRIKDSSKNLELDVSSSSSYSADRYDEIESQRSRESPVDSIFGSVPTKAEAEFSIQAFQSYMDDEGQRMLMENPGFQHVDTAFKFMRMPMVQEMVGSVMCDAGVISAMMRNDAVQAFLRSMMLGSSTLRLTNGETATTSANISQSSHNMVSVILSWLMDNIEAGIGGLFGIFRSLVNLTFESPQNANPCYGPNTSGAIYMTLFLSIILLMIVLVRRALKQKFKM